MIKALIIDDEPNNRYNLQYLLQPFAQELKVLGAASSAAEGRTLIKQQQPDLLFLDIIMPGEDGFDLLRSIPNPQFEVVFVTAYDQYGIQAIRFSAIDYLLKPIDPAELARAIAQVKNRIAEKRTNQQLHNLLHLLGHQKSAHRIALVTQKETRFIATADILYCTSTNNYTTFFLTGGEKLVVSKPIYEYEQMLSGYNFIRCHQSYLVNRTHVKSWVKEDGGYLLLLDGTSIPVSRNKKEEVRQQLLGS